MFSYHRNLAWGDAQRDAMRRKVEASSFSAATDASQRSLASVGYLHTKSVSRI